VKFVLQGVTVGPMAFSWITLCEFLGHSLIRCLEARIVMLVGGGLARSDQNVHDKRDGIMATLFIDGSWQAC
jgi:hypothetical protein